MPEAIPAGYLRLNEACEKLAASDSTVERHVRDERLRSTLVPREGRKPERVYLAEDVEALRRAKEERRERRPPSAVATVEKTPRLPQQQFEFARELRLLGAPPAENVTAKLWLSLDEASAFSGLGVGFLQKLIRTGELKGMKGGRRGSWIVSRKSVEAYEG